MSEENEDLITLCVGENEFTFEVTNLDINQYLNDVTPSNKINSAYNFLMRTVISEDKDRLKGLLLGIGNVVNGQRALEMVGNIMTERGGDITVSVKKRKAPAKELIKMVGDNFKS